MRRMRIKGISLLEILLVIAVTAVVLVSAIEYFANVRLASKVNTAAIQFRNIYQGAATYAKDQSYVAALPTTASINLGLPNSALLTNHYLEPSDFISPWGHDTRYDIFVYTTNGQLTLKVGVASLPVTACQRLYTRLKTVYPNLQAACPSSQAAAVNFMFTL